MSGVPFHHDVAALHDKLTSHIVRQDRKDQERAARKGRHFNHYALGLMLKVAQEARDEAEQDGGTKADWLGAVQRHFTVTRPMHTFLKKIDPTVGVERGHWVRK